MITSFPEIAGLASDNVRRKMADLRERGFADPLKMITYFPPILGLGIDNIRGKIASLRELGVAERQNREGVTSPREASRSLKGQKISYLRLGSAVERASPRSGLSATHGRKLHPALFKVSLHDCVGGRVCG
jgi:hypothetical protein